MEKSSLDRAFAHRYEKRRSTTESANIYVVGDRSSLVLISSGMNHSSLVNMNWSLSALRSEARFGPSFDFAQVVSSMRVGPALLAARKELMPGPFALSTRNDASSALSPKGR